MRRYRVTVSRTDTPKLCLFWCYAENTADARKKVAVMQGDKLSGIVELKSVPIPRYATPCPDCGIPDEDVYMVHNELWLAINGAYEGQLCVECFERRLGRSLTMADLKPDPPCNQDFFFKRPRIFYDKGAKAP